VDIVTNLFVFLQIAGFAVLAFRLTALHLNSSFRYFTAFCFFEPARIIVSVSLPRESNAYGYFFFGTQPLVWMFYVLITLEVFRHAFADHQGIYTASRKIMSWCVVGAVAIAAASAGIDLGRGSARYPILEFFLAADRTVTLSLLAFILALMAVLSWFPVPLNRNVLLHTVVFTFFFAAKAALLFSRNLFGPDFTRPGSLALFGVSIACLATWSVLLMTREQARIVRSGIERSPADEARLMAQLDAINETLAGTFRK
jgi:hypothetical protein